MITAVDTNVLIDVFGNDPHFGIASAEALRRCMREGSIVLCEAVLAELTAMFPSTRKMDENLQTLSIAFLPSSAMPRSSLVKYGGNTAPTAGTGPVLWPIS